MQALRQVLPPSAEASNRSLFQRVHRYALPLAVLAVTCSSLLILGLMVSMIRSDGLNYKGVEPNVIASVQKIMLGRPLYTDPGEFPFDLVQYSPFYYYICAGVARIVGLQADDAAGLFHVARGISAVMELLRMAVAYWLMRRVFGVDRWWSLLIVGFILTIIAPWNFVARPDSMLSILSLVAIALVLRGLRDVDGKMSAGSLLLAALAAALVVGAKQNGAVVIAANASFFLFARQWRNLIWFSTASAVFLAMLVGGFHLIWGEAVRQNLLDGLHNGLGISSTFRTIIQPMMTLFGAIVALAGVIVVKWWLDGGSQRQKLLGYMTFFLLAAALTSGLKAGSSINYCTETLTLMLIVIGIFVSQGRANEGLNSPLGLLGTFVAVYSMIFVPVFAVATFECYVLDRIDRRRVGEPISLRYAVADGLRNDLQQHPDSWVFSQDRGVDLLLADRAIAPQKEFVKILGDLKVVDYQKFRDAFSTGKVLYVVDEIGERPRPFVEVDFGSYRKIKDVGGFSIYKYDPQ